ncbi:MAG TPA: P1 family peptidase [Desulfuromonadales bacterium]|nr:P1 family peptidase [Desulfuromonadales bacterium]
MRIVFAYNQQQEATEEQAELFTPEDIEILLDAFGKLPYEIIPVEVSGPVDETVKQLLEARPDLIFNVAEGSGGGMREALFPAIYKLLGLPYTGGGSSLLLVDLNKRLSEKLLAIQGIRVPGGALLTQASPELPDDLKYPLFIKPNFEGSGIGIHQDSVVRTPAEARDLIDRMLEKFPEGLNAEEFIEGRELTVPMLEAWPGHLLEIVEYTFPEEGKYNVFDYERKKVHEDGKPSFEVHCPPELTPEQRQAVFSAANAVFKVMPCPDLGRADFRLHEDGTPYFLELNPLPRLLPDAAMAIAAKSKGMDLPEMLDLVIRSAASRYQIPLSRSLYVDVERDAQRVTCREAGISVGRFATGTHNAITDVAGVQVGHVTRIEDDVPVPDSDEKSTLRTGITAVVPGSGELFNNHMVAGGFVLNGIGEMSGLTQAMEWGWLETPILLTNTMSVGRVHSGVIAHMLKKHPELGRDVDVIIPLIGETNDAFLNEVRIPANDSESAMEAIARAAGGPVEQGSVGGGTGMISFDFAGGIGTSSRLLPGEAGGYTVGVLVQANFGKLHNLTVDGTVVGRQLDPLYPYDTRRGRSYGSVITVVATDAPLLSTQLNQLSKRAALGLGRVGSYAATTSGEIVFAFSTANRVARQAKEMEGLLEVNFISGTKVDMMYEAVVEATEEAVLNSMFCSGGMSGRKGRYAPPLPITAVQEILARCGRDLASKS